LQTVRTASTSMQIALLPWRYDAEWAPLPWRYDAEWAPPTRYDFTRFGVIRWV